MARTPIDQLRAAVAKALDEYEYYVSDNVTRITQIVARKGAAALRAESRAQFGNGPYARGWKVETRTDKAHKQLSVTSTIHNTEYRLTHLLEKGHVTRNGDRRTYPRTPAHVHIEPIEKELCNLYVKDVLSQL